MKPKTALAIAAALTVFALSPALCAAHHHAKHATSKMPSEAVRRQIYFLRAGTEYKKFERFPDINTPMEVTDAYQDKLMMSIDRRFGITEKQAKAIDLEGLTKKWPMRGEAGHVIQPR